jgi:hypothetical protein
MMKLYLHPLIYLCSKVLKHKVNFTFLIINNTTMTYGSVNDTSATYCKVMKVCIVRDLIRLIFPEILYDKRPYKVNSLKTVKQ